MFDHVTIRASDRADSECFYSTVLLALEREPTHSDEDFPEWNDFSLAQAGAAQPPTRRLHIGFAAPSRAHVDAFWRIGTEAGYRDDGPPGPRPEYGDDYYGGFLLDPDGNSAEAVHHDTVHTGGIDHLWIRVADLGTAKRFYEAVAPHAGLRLRRDTPERAQFTGAQCSLSLLPGAPTEQLHLAFPARSDEAVDAYHAVLTGAGYRDNGPPGERPVYHPGYYGAFVLDPDGNNVELVHHGRR